MDNETLGLLLIISLLILLFASVFIILLVEFLKDLFNE